MSQLGTFALLRSLAGLMVLAGILLPACKYSFNTASLPPEIESIAINKFQNNAPIVIPNYSQELTIALQDQFLSQTRLNLTDPPADLVITGTIVDYRIEPVNIQGNDRAAQNRLTVAVDVLFENNKFPEQSWENEFSTFIDFDQGTNLTAVQSALLEEINDQLVQDIFNKALGNW